jgi:hypothetical protein
MSFRTKFRRVALVLLLLAIINAPFALWVVYGTHLGSSVPDSSHTFGVSLRGGARFFTPFVGAYVLFSGILGVAGGASWAFRRLFLDSGD